MARRYYFAILPSTVGEGANSLNRVYLKGKNTMDWAVFFLAWAAMWVWVVRHRGAWNLIVANALGAASGMMVGLVFSELYIGLLGSSRPPRPEGMWTVFEFLTIAAALAGAWMWVARRSGIEHPIARQLLAGLCGVVAGVTALMFFAQIVHPGHLM